MNSFYASVECVKGEIHPLRTSLCVMSRADNSAGFILASSPMFTKVFSIFIIHCKDIETVREVKTSQEVMF